MQVSVENLEGLERKLKIEVPNDMVENAVNKKLAEIAKTARIDGFRPGKIPARVLKQRYGGAARQEAMGDIIQESYQQAIDETKIKPAGMPAVEFDEESTEDKFSYFATVEVYPEFELADVSGVEIEQEEVDITDEDIDGVIDNLLKARTTYDEVTRKAKKDDQLTIDFAGKIDGEAFEGGAAQGHQIIIGSKTMITGFESGLKGMKTGEEKTITCKFPKSYHVKDLAGKEADFDIKVHLVEGATAPKIDEDFIKNFGVESGTEEDFRAEVKANMQRELDNAIKSKNKNNAMDVLLEKNAVDAPKAMIQEEIKALQENIRQYTQADSKLDDSLFMDEAAKRVKLGLIISKIIDRDNVQADEAKVRAAVEEIAAPYNDPEQVVQYYYSQPQMLKNVEAMVIEDAVFENLIADANIKKVSKKYQEVIAK